MDNRSGIRNAEMNRIWRYVLVSDNGMAPCVDGKVLTLTCCKPTIRRNAKNGDWVIGFVPKKLGCGLVAWTGRVAEVVPLGDYQERYTARQDAIYKRGFEDGSEILNPLRLDYHKDERSRTRDRRGKNALIFNPFWYWGRCAVRAAPQDIANLAYYHIGQTTKGSSPEMLDRLEAWLQLEAQPGIHGDPRDKLAIAPLSKDWKSRC